MEWFRWYHGSVIDPKFKFVARKSGQPLTAVISVWAALLECASAAATRGDITSFDCESFDVAFDLPDGACSAILAAMESKDLIAAGRITKWEVRQPERERGQDNSTPRVQRHRQRKKGSNPDGNTHETDETRYAVSCNDETRDNDTKRHVTPGNALDKIREEEKRREENTPTQGTAGKGKGASVPGAVHGGSFEEPHGPVWLDDDPSLEFLQIRQYYNERIRHEAPRTGIEAYRQLRASGLRFPGLNAIMDAIDMYADAYGKAGCLNLVPGLARFLREHWWDNLIPPGDPRASPNPVKSFQQQAEDSFSQEFMALAAKDKAGREE